MTTHDPENAVAWQIERYLQGELSADERAALERDPHLRARVAALQSSNEAILELHPPAAFAAAVRAAARSADARAIRTLGRPRLLAVATLGTGAVAAVLWLAPRSPAPVAPRDVTRVKGLTPQVVLYRRAAAGIERLPTGSVARERDLLQIAYQAAGRRHGVIVSIDGRGTVTRHLPATGPSAAPLTAGAAVPLQEAYELDDAPGFERFYLVAADEPFAVEVVVDAIRRAGADGRLDLPAAMDQSSVVLEKERPR
jgi:anti-sigma factor RsiW